VIIELCESNEMALYIDTLESEGFDVVSYACLDRCARCVLFAYVFADGELVEAEEAVSVLGQIHRMKTEEEF
jgi:uncharacterized protein YuzB (UPF0349 family)